MRVYSLSYWLVIFCTTNSSQLLARERWHTFENSWKKTTLFNEHPVAYTGTSRLRRLWHPENEDADQTEALRTKKNTGWPAAETCRVREKRRIKEMHWTSDNLCNTGCVHKRYYCVFSKILKYISRWEFKKENKKTRTRPRKKEKTFFFFLITSLVSSCFLVFFYKFPPRNIF